MGFPRRVCVWVCAGQGDPLRLVRGKDYNGTTCGTQGTGSKVYYPRITEDILVFEASSSSKDPLDVRAACLDFS